MSRRARFRLSPRPTNPWQPFPHPFASVSCCCQLPRRCCWCFVDTSAARAQMAKMAAPPPPPPTTERKSVQRKGSKSSGSPMTAGFKASPSSPTWTTGGPPGRTRRTRGRAGGDAGRGDGASRGTPGSRRTSTWRVSCRGQRSERTHCANNVKSWMVKANVWMTFALFPASCFFGGECGLECNPRLLPPVARVNCRGGPSRVYHGPNAATAKPDSGTRFRVPPWRAGEGTYLINAALGTESTAIWRVLPTICALPICVDFAALALAQHLPNTTRQA